MKRVEGFPRRVGPESIEIEIGDVGTLEFPATMPNMRKAGARLGQRTVLVFVDGDVVSTVLDQDGNELPDL